MSVVIRIAWLGGNVAQPSVHAGQYVKTFDADAYDGRGYLVTTREKREALRFDSMTAAMKFYRQQSTVQPLRRSDGRPNRPLTAFTVTVENLKGMNE